MNIGDKIVLTEKAAKGLARALGIPTSNKNGKITITRGAKSDRLPVYGIVTHCTANFVDADWFCRANKKLYSRCFPIEAVRIIR